MPYKPTLLSLTTAGEQIVVPNGQVINGLSVSAVPRGVAYYVQFGNNPWSGPWSGQVTWTFGAGTAGSDTREGVKVRHDVAVPGGVIAFQVSYA